MGNVLLTPQASAEFAELPTVIKARVQRLLERLEYWPAVSGVRPLSGNLAGRFRMRTGDYRVQFRLKDQFILVEKVGHRDGFYEE